MALVDPITEEPLVGVSDLWDDHRNRKNIAVNNCYANSLQISIHLIIIADCLKVFM
jgi:hypothetical protein